MGDEAISAERLQRREQLNGLSEIVLDAAITIHKAFGSGLLESAYQRALVIELRERGLSVRAEVPVEARWRGKPLGNAFFADVLVDNRLLIELKAVREVTNVHRAQARTYLKLLDYRLGLLINFHALRLIDGYERIVNDF